MKDAYLNFSNSRFGAKLTSMLGLPQPLILDRYNDNESTIINGPVLIGGQGTSPVFNAVLSQLKKMSVHTTVHSQSGYEHKNVEQWNKENTNIKGVIFDATNLSNSSQTISLHTFFKDCFRSISANGRVIIIGRPPENAGSIQKATVQRALEGLSRSLAKELRKAISVQLIYVEKNAENELESTLRFLLSAKSTYVSGQVIRIASNFLITNPDNSVNEFDWSKPLTGKKVLVTGASQGIGAAIAEVMVREGGDVICLDVPQTSKALKAIASKLSARSLELNLVDSNATEILVNSAKKDGGWDVIIHNAGITRDKTIANMPEEFWSSVIDVNLSSQERINNALLEAKLINANGRIICVSSISGIAGNRGQSNYALSKAGVIGMVQSMSPMLNTNNITINAVAPGFIETSMTAKMPFAVREAGRRLNSMSQGGHPVDVAEAIAWFANPASNGVSGNIVRVCGQSLLGA